MGVPHFVEHLREVALAQFGVGDGFDQLSGAFHSGVLTEVDDREHRLHDFHPAGLSFGRGLSARERILHRAVLAIIFLLFHR
jgi:hypothetical protein